MTNERKKTINKERHNDINNKRTNERNEINKDRNHERKKNHIKKQRNQERKIRNKSPFATGAQQNTQVVTTVKKSGADSAAPPRLHPLCYTLKPPKTTWLDPGISSCFF